jgi:hypothetical protein
MKRVMRQEQKPLLREILSHRASSGSIFKAGR